MTAPVQQPKVNLHRLLRQVQTQKEQEDFFIKNGLPPKSIECSCSPREKIPVTKDTMMYQSKLYLPVYLVLLYSFCYRWKYSDVKRETDLESPASKKKFSQKIWICKTFTPSLITVWNIFFFTFSWPLYTTPPSTPPPQRFWFQYGPN